MEPYACLPLAFFAGIVVSALYGAWKHDRDLTRKVANEKEEMLRKLSSDTALMRISVDANDSHIRAIYARLNRIDPPKKEPQ